MNCEPHPRKSQPPLDLCVCLCWLRKRQIPWRSSRTPASSTKLTQNCLSHGLQQPPRQMASLSLGHLIRVSQLQTLNWVLLEMKKATAERRPGTSQPAEKRCPGRAGDGRESFALRQYSQTSPANSGWRKPKRRKPRQQYTTKLSPVSFDRFRSTSSLRAIAVTPGCSWHCYSCPCVWHCRR